MSTQLQTQTKIAQQSSFTPVQTGILQRKCACGQHTVAGSKCEECQQKPEGVLQRSAVSSAPVNAVPPIVHEVLSSPGQSLDVRTKAFMEPRFGHDFSQVRVHTDARAVESARAVNALAYTVGRDVVFGEGEYEPGASGGRRLLAHELTHVVQQGGKPKVAIGEFRIGQPGGVHEHEADEIAEAVVLGQEMPKISPSSYELYIQRQGKPTGVGDLRVAEAHTDEEGRKRQAQIAERLLVVTLQTEQMRPLFESDDNLRSQHDFLTAHIRYVTDLLLRAGQAGQVDTNLLRAAEVGLDLAGLAYDLMRTDREATSRGIAGVVRSGVNRGLAWTWEGMRELKADPSWPVLKPDHAQKVLLNAEAQRDNVLAAVPFALVMRAGVIAASIVSGAEALSDFFIKGLPALGRIANWMGGLKIETVALKFAEGVGGVGFGFRVVSSAGALALTDAEVIALAEAGKISATALNLYMTAQGPGGGKLPRPTLPSGVQSANEFGTKIMKWGTGNDAARARIATLTREELQRAGVTREMAEAWRDFYRNEMLRNPNNPSAAGRADLMQRAVELLSGG